MQNEQSLCLLALDKEDGKAVSGWSISVRRVITGEETMTERQLKRLKTYLEEEVILWNL